MTKSKAFRTTVFIILLIFAAGFTFRFISLYNKKYTAEDFKIKVIKSESDKNANGIDDYTDLYLGAKYYVSLSPKYKSEYLMTNKGYPAESLPDGTLVPSDTGVCTDVIWYAFYYAGFSLKDMVDKDIAENTHLYSRTNGTPDTFIDFRRVANLKVFFKRYAIELTTDPRKIEEWQPGDIVIYSNPDHIAIISDERDFFGRPYIIHHGGRSPYISKFRKKDIVAHYRFDYSYYLEKLNEYSGSN